jgi:hypothetical protein
MKSPPLSEETARLYAGELVELQDDAWGCWFAGFIAEEQALGAAACGLAC